MKPWGFLLSLDIAKCKAHAIRSDTIIKAFTQQLVRDIDMVAYGQPWVERFGSGNKYGYTLVQLIETSNITAHFCEDSGDMYLDVFSCKEFSPKTVEDVVRQYFEPFHIKSHFVERQALQ